MKVILLKSNIAEEQYNVNIAISCTFLLHPKYCLPASLLLNTYGHFPFYSQTLFISVATLQQNYGRHYFLISHVGR